MLRGQLRGVYPHLHQAHQRIIENKFNVKFFRTSSTTGLCLNNAGSYTCGSCSTGGWVRILCDNDEIEVNTHAGSQWRGDILQSHGLEWLLQQIHPGVKAVDAGGPCGKENQTEDYIILCELMEEVHMLKNKGTFFSWRDITIMSTYLMNHVNMGHFQVTHSISMEEDTIRL